MNTKRDRGIAFRGKNGAAHVIAGDGKPFGEGMTDGMTTWEGGETFYNDASLPTAFDGHKTR